MLPEYQTMELIYNIHAQCFITSLICCVQCHCSDLPPTIAAPLKPETVTGLSTVVDLDMWDSGSPPHDKQCKSTVLG